MIDPDEHFDAGAVRAWVAEERPELAADVAWVLANAGQGQSRAVRHGRAVQALMAVAFAAGVRKGKGLT